ncbi:response regulator [Paenibacillus pini]|uniref:Response regulator n=1 Tax=Paenibacillus pini JCM 16418 TaxID=1236976 RepID=W7YHG2_9BACL|nr:response regulator [Paenibacillus pini]GAF10360.1 response regulator [Paenibacillus pini JCM 16418]
MRALIIDDEKPALLQLERLLQADGRISVAGQFTSVQSGLNHLLENHVDVIFLDIGMPEMNGLEAAEHFYRMQPEIQIVYVTAYNNYAIEAFELHALDYLLKPVDPERFSKTIKRIESHMQLSNMATTPITNPSMAMCFSHLTLMGPSGELKLKWRTQKVQELFSFFIHHTNKWITKETLLETLWPELGLDKATTQLHTSIYQVRKVLKEWGVGAGIEYAHDSYRLLKEGFVTDIELFKQDCTVHSLMAEEDWQRLDAALKRYKGDYLEDHDYFWARPLREELNQMYIEASLRAAGYEHQTGKSQQAIQRLLVLQQKEAFSEEICRSILIIYASMNNYNALLNYYNSYMILLRDELGIEPDVQTTQLYNKLMSEVREDANN